MSPNLEQALIRDFPDLFAGVARERKALADSRCFGPIAFGCDVGDGWEPLIRRTCVRLSGLKQGIELTQVKEKWGRLVIYISGWNDEAQEILDQAENDSGRVCEHCGKPGTHRTSMWWHTTCDECENSNSKQRNAATPPVLNLPEHRHPGRWIR